MLYDLSNPLQREQFRGRVGVLWKKEGAIVELTEKKPQRSGNQNKYLHLILSYFACQYGETPEYVKQEYFKRLCNSHLFVLWKNDRLLPEGHTNVLRSSRDLTTEQMTEAIERFRNWSAKEAGIYLPSPEDERLLALAEVEISRNMRNM